MTYLFENYKRAPIEFVKAEGSYLIDSEGKAYLDFSSGIGVTNLGFHPQVQQALIQQAGRIWHSPNLYLSSCLLYTSVAEIKKEIFHLTSTYTVTVLEDSYADLVISLCVAIDYVEMLESSSS